jgi:putative transposase
MTEDPETYAWSSCAAHCGREDPILTAHPAYAALGTSLDERGSAYRFLLREVLSDDVVQEIRAYLNQQRALGRDAFQAMVEAKTRRFAAVRPAHRPPKQAVDAER